MTTTTTTPLVIRQGGLRFLWDRGHHIHVTKPNGEAFGFIFAGKPTTDAATLEEAHAAIDAYCRKFGLSGLDKKLA